MTNYQNPMTNGRCFGKSSFSRAPQGSARRRATALLYGVVALVASVALVRSASAETAALEGSYAIVVSSTTMADSDWKPVVDALLAKHQARQPVVIAYDAYEGLDDAMPRLVKLHPRYTCFVATPKEAGREFVAEVHKLTRKLDDDPYTDTLWGILTGYDAATALRIAKQTEPLVIHKVAAGTEVALEKCGEGICYSELKAGEVVRKQAGAAAESEHGPADSTAALVDSLNKYQTDLFVTSGHATERDWQIGFAYKNGYFRSRGGELFGLDTKQQKHVVASPNPKVYLAVGNCLMGHIDGPDAMALAWLKSAGVDQMVGYTVNTWYGYGGWGMLDYFVEQPGRYTLAEAFFANHQALLHKLQTEYPTLANAESGENARNGLLYDRDVVAFYGDPAWSARMAPADCAWEQQLTERDGEYTLTITPKLGEKTFAPVNTNGSERGGRPIIALLPQRIKDAKVTAGADLQPVLTDDFVLVPLPTKFDSKRKYEVKFSAEAR